MNNQVQVNVSEAWCRFVQVADHYPIVEGYDAKAHKAEFFAALDALSDQDIPFLGAMLYAEFGDNLAPSEYRTFRLSINVKDDGFYSAAYQAMLKKHGSIDLNGLDKRQLTKDAIRRFVSSRIAEIQTRAPTYPGEEKRPIIGKTGNTVYTK